MKKFKELFGLMSKENLGPEPIVINLEDGLWTVETASSFDDPPGRQSDGLFAYGEGDTLDEAISNFEKSLEKNLMEDF